jgi:outer membrane lipoprotein SlyB
MFGKWFFALLAPLALAITLGACNQGGVQPGVIQTSAAGGFRGEVGRVVSIRDIDLRETRRGFNDGTLIGGGLGAAGGAVAGAAIGGTAGSAVLGGVLGAVGGAIVGTAVDRNSTTRGIAVTVQKDDGTQVTIAQRDDGDVQMGDRVMIVYDNEGIPRVIRDTGRRRDI